ncbi:MAG: archease [Thermoplasmatales archaeon]|nr:archease [Thermoplasmatales archaeon]MCK4996338.1 archease [Thermoplasmatales archaeon]
MKTYELIDHTADVGVKAYGRTLSEAFENAAKAMFDIITDTSEIESVGQYNIELEAPDLEQLLVDWLSELLFLNSAKNLVFGFFKMDLDEKNKKLTAKVFGEKFDLSKHKIGSEIKAVTYHMLEVKKKKPYHVQVLFDI